MSVCLPCPRVATRASGIDRLRKCDQVHDLRSAILPRKPDRVIGRQVGRRGIVSQDEFAAVGEILSEPGEMRLKSLVDDSLHFGSGAGRSRLTRNRGRRSSTSSWGIFPSMLPIARRTTIIKGGILDPPSEGLGEPFLSFGIQRCRASQQLDDAENEKRIAIELCTDLEDRRAPVTPVIGVSLGRGVQTGISTERQLWPLRPGAGQIFSE